MQINIKAMEIDLTPALKIYIERKLGPLSKFIKRFDEAGQAELWVEVARMTRHHHKGLVFMAEGRLPLPKKALHVVERHDDVRKAVDAMKRTLRLEIEKYKTKHAPKTIGIKK